MGGSRTEPKQAQEEDASFGTLELNPYIGRWSSVGLHSIQHLSARSTRRPRASQYAAVDACYSRTRGSNVNTGGGGRQQIWECKSGVIQLAQPQSAKPASIIGFLCCCCVPDSFRKDILPRECRLAARLLGRPPPSSPLPPLRLNNSLRPHISETHEGFNMGNFLRFSVYQRVFAATNDILWRFSSKENAKMSKSQISTCHLHVSRRKKADMTNVKLENIWALM